MLTSISPVCHGPAFNRCYDIGHLVICEDHNRTFRPGGRCIKCKGQEMREAKHEWVIRNEAAKQKAIAINKANDFFFQMTSKMKAEKRKKKGKRGSKT